MAAVLANENDLLIPQGLGHDLLTTWAPWARDDRDERHSWAVKPRVMRGYWGNPPDEYWIVDKIVAPHRRDGKPHWRLVARWYLGEKSAHQISMELGRKDWPEKRVLMNLVIFCSLVEREYLDVIHQPGMIRPTSAPRARL